MLFNFLGLIFDKMCMCFHNLDNCWSLVSIWKFIYIFFKCVSFWLHNRYGTWEGWAFKPEDNHNGWMNVVGPPDRPKLVRYHCAIERFCSVVMFLWLCIVCRLNVFVLGLRQISCLFFFTAVLYCWCHSDSASVLLLIFFIFFSLIVLLRQVGR